MPKFSLVFALMLGFLAFSTPPELGAETKGRTALTKKLNKILKNPALKKAQKGILVKSLDRNEILYEVDSRKALIPASNIKLLTTYTALKELGLHYQFKTYFYTNRYLKKGGIEDLFVRGQGDPHLVIERLWRMAGDLRARGIQSIHGDIVIDGSFFDDRLYPPGWPQNPSSEAYYAPNAAFAVNFNTVTVYVWPGTKPGKIPKVFIDPNIDYLKLENQARTISSSGKKQVKIERLTRSGGDYIRVSGNFPVNARPMIRYRHITQPLQYAGAVLRYVLENRGIEVKGKVRVGSIPKDVEEIFVEKSPPLLVLVKAVNKRSNNFMAEQILKTMGAKGTQEPASTQRGLQLMKEHLNRMGVSPEEYRLENGSGLGRGNRISARAFVRVLETAWKDPVIRPEFLSSLALGGLDGTLEDRMDNNPSSAKLEESEKDIDEREEMDEKNEENELMEWEPQFPQVRAKTGSLNHVSCISGYLIRKNDEKLAFSILMNGFPEKKQTTIHHIQDQFLKALIEEKG